MGGINYINWNVGPTLTINGGRLKETGALRYVGIFCSQLIVKQDLRSYSSAYSTLKPFSEEWCKDKKVEIYKKGFPAVFEDMSKIKNSDYFAINNCTEKPFSLKSLKDTPGIYMITNKITKKIYIGMSINIKGRILNYLDINRLIRDKSIRIHRALLKYGFDKFSISILELYPEKERNSVKSSFLREREDFFIKVFKPQYNIKRSVFNKDKELETGFIIKVKVEIPTKIKNLLDKCLDPTALEWNLIIFNYFSNKEYYKFSAITPNGVITANSSGWFEGKIHKTIGFEDKKIEKPSIKYIINTQQFNVNKEALAQFYLNEKPGFVKERLKMKLMELKAKVAKHHTLPQSSLTQSSLISLNTQSDNVLNTIYSASLSKYSSWNGKEWVILSAWDRLSNRINNNINWNESAIFVATKDIFYITGVMCNRDVDKLTIYAESIINSSNWLACNEAKTKLLSLTGIKYDAKQRIWVKAFN